MEHCRIAPIYNLDTGVRALLLNRGTVCVHSPKSKYSMTWRLSTTDQTQDQAADFVALHG